MGDKKIGWSLLVGSLLFLCGCGGSSGAQLDSSDSEVFGAVSDSVEIETETSDTDTDTDIDIDETPPEIAVVPDNDENEIVPLTTQEMFFYSVTGVSYPVDIYLPEDYNASDETYPIIYATDGQWTSLGYSWIVNASGKSVILVSIHQGGPGNRRSVDYSLPGATTYYDFLATELVPTIESRFRVDSSDRMLVGSSRGGVLMTVVLFIDDVVTPLFNKILMMDTPFLLIHNQETRQLEEARFAASQDMNVRIMMTSALLPAASGPFDTDTTAFQELLESRDYNGLEIIRRAYQVDHFNVNTPSFIDAMQLLID